MLRLLLPIAILFAPQAHAHAQPLVTSRCADASDPVGCEQRRSEFLNDLPQALKGAYLPQRELAFCLMSGCRGAVAIDLVQACAWYQLIVENSAADVTDKENLRSYCNGLDAGKMQGALSLAKRLRHTIHQHEQKNGLAPMN